MEEAKKRKKAAAIQYDPQESAPTLIAKGQGLTAEKIIEAAMQEEIPVVENKELVEELSKMDLGEHIPPELYQVVAEVLVFISDLDNLRSKTERF